MDSQIGLWTGGERKDVPLLTASLSHGLSGCVRQPAYHMDCQAVSDSQPITRPIRLCQTWKTITRPIRLCQTWKTITRPIRLCQTGSQSITQPIRLCQTGSLSYGLSGFVRQGNYHTAYQAVSDRQPISRPIRLCQTGVYHMAYQAVSDRSISHDLSGCVRQEYIT